MLHSIIPPDGAVTLRAASILLAVRWAPQLRPSSMCTTLQTLPAGSMLIMDASVSHLSHTEVQLLEKPLIVKDGRL